MTVTNNKYLLASVLGMMLCSGAAAPAQNTGQPHLVTRPRYTIQPGDKIDLAFRYTPELNQSVTVQPDGYITLQSLGEVKVSDLTVTAATDLVTQKSSAHLKNPSITLTLKEMHKPFYVVAGEVQRPGRFDMDQSTTALQAVLEAGGAGPAAKSSQVIVFRRINEQDDEVHVLDLHKIRTQSDLEHDMMLQPGDMIFVPRDRISKIDRLVHASNVGLFFNPGIF